MLEVRLAAEVLEVGILIPTLDHRFIGEVVGVLEVEQPGDQPRRCRRPSGLRDEEFTPLTLEHRPVDALGEPYQWMTRVEEVLQSAPEQIVLGGASFVARAH